MGVVLDVMCSAVLCCDEFHLTSMTVQKKKTVSVIVHNSPRWGFISITVLIDAETFL